MHARASEGSGLGLRRSSIENSLVQQLIFKRGELATAQNMYRYKHLVWSVAVTHNMIQTMYNCCLVYMDPLPASFTCGSALLAGDQQEILI